jgi:6-methylsalicylate decarboxylase
MQGLIDVHHHILPPDYVTAIGARIGAQGLTGAVPDWNPSLSVEAMDRNGIASAITSISSPGIWFGDPGETRDLARYCNEYAADMAKDYPGRFGYFAVLPLPDIDASLREIAYAFDTLGAEGVGLLTNYDGRYPGDPEFTPVFEELNRRKATVFYHPTLSKGWDSLPEIPVPTLEFPFDTTRAVVNMLHEGVFLRYQDIRFIFVHAGGAIPFLAERINRLAVLPKFRENVPEGVRPVLKRLYFDVALSANPLCMSTTTQVVDSRKLFFGSDFPHAGEPTMTATVEGLADLDSFFDMRAEALLTENARDVFALGS